MTTYIPTICFIIGMIAGAGILCLGMFISWKASYSIRNHREGFADNDGQIFKTAKDPAEFDLLEKEQKEEARFETEE